MSQTPLEETAPPAPSAPSENAWARWRPLVLRLHFYAGLFVGPFILVAAITGLMYALIPQIDSLSTRHERTVAAIGDHQVPLSEQLAAARAAHPEGAVVSIRPPAQPDETTRIRLAVDDVPPDYARTVFVDPYSAEVRGALTTYGEWMPLRAWFDELHRNLHLGVVGRYYSELAASWLWVVALAGAVLWIGHRRSTGKLRRLFVPDRGTTGRRRLLSWHGALGVWIIVGLLGLSVTGMTWSRFAGESINGLQEQLRSTPPSVDTSLAIAAASGEPGSGGHGHHGGTEAPSEFDERVALAGADTALRTARDAGLRGPMWMYPPAAADEGWLVAESKRDWPTRYDAISVHPETGEITHRVDQSEWPFFAKLTYWAIDAHMGILFGVVNQILLIATAGGLIAGVLIGYRMWWRRRPTRGGMPPRPGRGALAGLTPWEGVVLVAVLASIGWFAPLFGVTLAAFVAVDVALGWYKNHRQPADPTPADPSTRPAAG